MTTVIHIIQWLFYHWKLSIALIIVLFAAILFLRRKILKNAGMRKIDRMSGEEFERYLTLKLKETGRYKKVRHVGQSGDYGADVILYDKKNRKIVVQAKRYRGYVGIAAVQQVIGAVKYYDADEGWVITNSTFSDAAKNLASTSNVTLYDRTFLYGLINGRIDKKALNQDENEDITTDTIALIYRRAVYPPEGMNLTEKAVEHKIDEFLISNGFTIKKS